MHAASFLRMIRKLLGVLGLLIAVSGNGLASLAGVSAASRYVIHLGGGCGTPLLRATNNLKFDVPVLLFIALSGVLLTGWGQCGFRFARFASLVGFSIWLFAWACVWCAAWF